MQESTIDLIVNDKDPTSLKAEKRRTDSRRRLMDAARELFVQQGYHATRPQDVSRKAGVGHGTFYLYFKDKRECFLAFVEEARAGLTRYLEEQSGGLSMEQMGVYPTLVMIAEYAGAHDGVLRAAMADIDLIDPIATNEESLVDKWAKDWVEALQASAETSEEITNYEICGHAIVGAVVQVTAQVGKIDDPVEQEKILRELADFIIRATGLK